MPKYSMPVGKSNFEKVRTAGDYYIDKTMLIEQITASSAEVTLFTRPRRFGKSLNMSMLQHFFDIREDNKALFEGLAISENKELCENWMNQYPTILVSFKAVDAISYDYAEAQLKIVLADLFRDHIYLLQNADMNKNDAETIRRITAKKADMSDMMDSLSLLTRLLYHHYNKPVILLIDEYDVPMAKGDANGYYREITNIMRSMYNKSLKDNPYIKLAVLTGCLRIAEESIFTGLNNLVVKDITDTQYDEYFGFTSAETEKLLTDTELSEHLPECKEWYDGYIFGNKEVYCPWNVLNYIDALQHDTDAVPMNYWANTSGNDAVRRFLESDFDVSEEFETLLGGGYIEKIINPNITYGNLIKSESNLWSVLYMTGYLTILQGSQPKRSFGQDGIVRGKFELPFKLRLPNREIKILFEQTIATWFEEKIFGEDRTELFNAIWSGDEKKLASEINKYLGDTISYLDYHENFYHAFLAGLLSGVKGVKVKSNREVGTGRADVILQNPRMGRVAIFEFKCTKEESQMDKLCDEAVRQIADRKYSFPFREEVVYKYGIAFYQKKCTVKKA